MKNKGITLIALIITIIVMLILVAVTITMAVNGGLFGYAGNAARDTELAKQEEQQLETGQIEIDGRKYYSLDDYVNGSEGTPIYSERFLNTDGVLITTAEYTDINSETAIIPAGFGIVTGCETINKGLVISDEFDNNGNSIGNEFVWIPIPEKNFKVATPSNLYGSSSNYSEPRKLTNTDSNTSSEEGGPFQYDSQKELDYYYGSGYYTFPANISDETNVTDFSYGVHYKEMAESINQYGGFYIGRYETTIETVNGVDKIGCKANKTVLQANQIIKNIEKPYRWWGLYATQRHANIPGNGEVVQTNMIWRQPWKKMLTYFDNHNIDYDAIDTDIYNLQYNVLNSGQATYTNKTDNTDVIKDVIFNIYDLRMNALDWTAESNNTLYRVTRGGAYDDSRTPALRSNIYPRAMGVRLGTRLTLYIL